MKTEFKSNGEARKHAVKFIDDELLAFFDKIEKEERYGSLVHEPGGLVKAEYVFNKGVCLRCIEPLRGKKNTFLDSKKFNLKKG